MDYQTSCILARIGLALGLICFGIATQVGRPADMALLVVGAVVFLAGEICKSIWFRCPKCKKHLGSRQGLPPAFCPHCGTKLGVPEDQE